MTIPVGDDDDEQREVATPTHFTSGKVFKESTYSYPKHCCYECHL